MNDEILKKLTNREKALRFKLITYPGTVQNRYYISEYGDVYDAIKDKFRKSFLSNRKYMVISFNGKQFPIHRLVAWEFYPDTRDMNLTVDHKDGDKLNNDYTNLEWVSLKENIRRAYTNGLHGGKGYSSELVRAVCELYELGKSPIDVYRMIRGTDNTPRGNKADESFYRFLVSIRNKTTREDIVSNYNFPDKKDVGLRVPSDQTLLSQYQIKLVAQLYVSGKNYVDILKILGIDRGNPLFDRYYYIVMRICKQQSWTNITDEIFKNFKNKIVTVRNGGRFTEDQVRRICSLFKDGMKDPVELLSNIGIRKTHRDFSLYYDGLMGIIHGKAWTRISRDYFTPTTFTRKTSHHDYLDDEFIFEMFNKGYNSGDVARMYGLGSKKENEKLYKAIVHRMEKFKKIKETLEFCLSEDDVENHKIEIWASQF